MQWVTGNIWQFHSIGRVIVIPTNAGWKNSGENVMGRGLARDAAQMFPELPIIYGAFCQAYQPHQYFKEYRLICVPSKGLNKKKPQLSWKQPSDIFIITESLMWLEEHANEFSNTSVYVPVLGTGNGELEREPVVELMNELLKNPKFIGVLKD